MDRLESEDCENAHRDVQKGQDCGSVRLVFGLARSDDWTVDIGEGDPHVHEKVGDEESPKIKLPERDENKHGERRGKNQEQPEEDGAVGR